MDGRCSYRACIVGPLIIFSSVWDKQLNFFFKHWLQLDPCFLYLLQIFLIISSKVFRVRCRFLGAIVKAIFQQLNAWLHFLQQTVAASFSDCLMLTSVLLSTFYVYILHNALKLWLWFVIQLYDQYSGHSLSYVWSIPRSSGRRLCTFCIVLI